MPAETNWSVYLLRFQSKIGTNPSVFELNYNWGKRTADFRYEAEGKKESNQVTYDKIYENASLAVRYIHWWDDIKSNHILFALLTLNTCFNASFFVVMGYTLVCCSSKSCCATSVILRATTYRAHCHGFFSVKGAAAQKFYATLSLQRMVLAWLLHVC